MTTIKKILSIASTVALGCGFIIIVGAPEHIDSLGGTLLDVMKQLVIGIIICGIGLFMRRYIK